MKKTALTILLAVFVWHVFRAATLPILTEEAVTYNEFVSQPVLKILSSPYSPANQVLHSLLCHLILRAFRVTEFALRIASLLGLSFYLWQAFLLVPPVSTAKLLALGVLLINPCTIGWLPQSTGFWFAAGLFLFAIRKLILRDFSSAGIALGFACCFYISFCFPAFVLLLVGRRFNQLLPATVIWFCFWCLPMVNANPESLTVSRLTPLPNRFTVEPGSNLPRVARQLRDELRRHPSRPILVATSPGLIDRMDFYRRRYALGAVRKIVSVNTGGTPDYSIVLDQQSGQAKLNATTLVDMHH